MRRPLRVAAVQPAYRPSDIERNAVVHAEVVRAARVRLVVFPELSLTGYDLEADVVDPDDDALAPVTAACAATDSIALVGAPVAGEDGREFIAMLRVDAAGVGIAYRKSWLGGAEPERFQCGDGPTVLMVDGWRMGLGICKDTGAAQHIAGTAALGVDAYLAGLVHHLEELPEQDARVVVIARTCRAFVVFAGFAGPTGGGFATTAGSSTIWSPDGVPIARTGPEIGGIARATLS